MVMLVDPKEKISLISLGVFEVHGEAHYLQSCVLSLITDLSLAVAGITCSDAQLGKAEEP